MNIVVAEFRNVVINDVRDTADIDSSTNNIGGNQQSQLSGPQIPDHSVTSALRQITMNGGNPIRLESSGKYFVQLVSATFGSCKHDCLSGLLLSNDSQQRGTLSVLVDSNIKLFNRVDHDIVFGQIHHLWVDHVPPCQLFDRFRHRGGQQQGLTLLRAVLQNAFNVRTEADVQHAICFIQHDDLQLVQLKNTATQQIDNSARRSNDSLSTVFELSNLGVDRSASDAQRKANAPATQLL